MKKIIIALTVLALITAGAFFLLIKQNHVEVLISLSSDESPLIDDIYEIGELSVIDGYVEASLFEGGKLFILEELSGEYTYSLDVPEVEVGDALYRLVLKNEFVDNETRISANKYGAYIWFFDAEIEGGYPVVRFDAFN